jgi:outer membrane protein TolC
MKNRILVVIISLFCSIILSPSIGLAETALTFEASFDIALKNSVIIHSAKEGIRASEAQKKEAMMGFLPKVNTSYSYQRFNEAPFSKFIGLPAPFSSHKGIKWGNTGQL